MKTTDQAIFFLMGVSGCGKSTVGELLARRLDIPFFDGDDFHPESNIAKMSKGTPLKDEDRVGWLRRLNELAKSYSGSGAVIACSALKAHYRDMLMDSLKGRVHWIYLEGSFEEIEERLNARKGHFMPKGLLRSQFNALEVPDRAIHVPIKLTPEEIVLAIEEALGGFK
ncbi:gluconokinase [Poritiphilus flavus]|uniref:Gluconokinase n=1 Tax=Poritiphilus flavus TaxID=2697053 RepID=A0A6L9EF47_9FLAO|nr:gluconokinase [Poritiphilus flavus]NAS13394.1 AAA family ATPase [Poritiphilus flavus]